MVQFTTNTETSQVNYRYVRTNFLDTYHFGSTRNGDWILPDDFSNSLSVQLAAHHPGFAKAIAINPRLHIEQNMGKVIGW